MLYSCLTDADFLDTEAFMSDNRIVRGGYETPEQLNEKLERYLSRWQNPQSELNRKRNGILQTLKEKGSLPRGLFTLTVPTGGGKTVSSLAFALRHVLSASSGEKNTLRRIVYVIPYTSIIEQTQEVFEKIFGAENVVAHYADVDYGEDDGIGNRKKLSTENWDAPIILTTAVQFFESLFANRSSKCRKLHNIANSVLIFDEAQMLPLPYLKPCLHAICQLVRNYGCSAVLCTATQPAFEDIFHELLPEYPVRELCPKPGEMYEFFKRVSYMDEGLISSDILVGRLKESEEVLCVVNTRLQAQTLYEALPPEGTYHLSTAMIPEDRRKTIEEVRIRLKQGLPCRVVSTSLIEAGVDLDFPEVWRELSGLDSVIQAGGRCNREGKRKREESFVHYFTMDAKSPQSLRQNISATKHVIRQFDDISSPEAIKMYFEFLRKVLAGDEAQDKKSILKRVNEENMPFASVAKDFRLIENSDRSVVIPSEDCTDLLTVLKNVGPDRWLWRKLGKYTVTVPEKMFDALIMSGSAELVAENMAVLTDLSLYHKKTGLVFGDPKIGLLCS